MSEGISICIDKDGWTGGYQLSINDSNGGFRLKGPKFNGSSQRILTYFPTDSDLDVIEKYISDERKRRKKQ